MCQKENFMKKFYVLLTVLCIVFLVSACTNTGENNNSNSPQAADVEMTDGQEEKGKTETADETISNITEISDTADMTDNGNKILVAYFSATGNTKPIAEYAAEALKGDLYEIVPMEPYTDSDLNYNNNSSRSTVEQNDVLSRPEISGTIPNMDDYDTIFIGYPIWWGQAPKIIYTFVESYDLSNKTIIPFCTSGSSPIGSSAQNLHSSASESANWLDGRRFQAGASRKDVTEWITDLDL